jgi:predicted MFS family arabinose efflux permease
LNVVIELRFSREAVPSGMIGDCGTVSVDSLKAAHHRSSRPRPLSTNAVATFVLMFLLGIAGMGIPPVGTGLAVRFAPAAPTLAAISVSAFNGGTAIGTWLGASALESTLGVLGPLTVAIIMAVLGLLALLAMAVMRMTSEMD